MTTATNIKNFLPLQYERDGSLPINHNYLQQQFADYEEIFAKLKQVVVKGDFTLGEHVDRFEENYSRVVNAKHAIGVGSGTDALFLSLKALGVKEGDEVITTPYTFYATIGAIVTAGARPVFADILDDYNIDPDKIEERITPKTKVILPVHWAGKPCHMDRINEVAKKHGLFVVEDSCHGIKATYKDRPAGSLGDVGCFSFHPLKNLNVWGDGGIITTSNDEVADRLRLMRNHGLKGRDECVLFAYNSRLDTLQAVVAQHLLDKRIDGITEGRIRNANYLDKHLADVNGITVPVREDYIKQVYHLYCIQVEKRDELVKFLIENGVDAKIHYPVPMHLQPAAAEYGYKKGDFPVCERMAEHTMSLPVHEFITEKDLEFVVTKIKEFYGQS